MNEMEIEYCISQRPLSCFISSRRKKKGFAGLSPSNVGVPLPRRQQWFPSKTCEGHFSTVPQFHGGQ